VSITSPSSLRDVEAARIEQKAARYLKEVPVTVTAEQCERSEGGRHDYYSEGDYWWPDPTNPAGPYIRRDGETNPNLFYNHRHALVRLSEIIGTLASAFLLDPQPTILIHAIRHLRAWFVDPDTRMTPNLLYGQAIKGRNSGRSIGIIDTLHLCEVARGAKILCQSPNVDASTTDGIKSWFRAYLDWINTHEYGITEKVHPNNHGVCWSVQASAFADFVGDDDVLAWVRTQFRDVYLTEMMDDQGGFPAELARTKPYGYSLFMIDAVAAVAQIASSPNEDLWRLELPDGRGMAKGIAFIHPYIADKRAWPYGEDVLYWDEWPVRHPSLLLGGLNLGRPEWLDTWTALEPDPRTFEVLRNLPLRHPLIWVEDATG
tara:strand:- start:953 stop:2074 length:1122 start_codon:yes stop_codon:yes gene_type:complete